MLRAHSAVPTARRRIVVPAKTISAVFRRICFCHQAYLQPDRINLDRSKRTSQQSLKNQFLVEDFTVTRQGTCPDTSGDGQLTEIVVEIRSRPIGPPTSQGRVRHVVELQQTARSTKIGSCEKRAWPGRTGWTAPVCASRRSFALWPSLERSLSGGHQSAWQLRSPRLGKAPARPIPSHLTVSTPSLHDCHREKRIVTLPIALAIMYAIASALAGRGVFAQNRPGGPLVRNPAFRT